MHNNLPARHKQTILDHYHQLVFLLLLYQKILHRNLLLLYYYKNGAIQNSGTGIVIPAAADTLFGAWFPAVGDWDTPSHVWSCNFGEGFFGTTAAGTEADDNGQGLFAYDVPAGYYAMNTKNLEAYG